MGEDHQRERKQVRVKGKFFSNIFQRSHAKKPAPELIETATSHDVTMMRYRKLPPRELQQLWFATLHHAWSSLVVVPSHANGSGYVVAEALADVGSSSTGTPVKLIDAEGLDLKETVSILKMVAAHVAAGGKVVVAVDSVVRSLAGIPLAQGVDAVIMTVSLQNADLASARRTIELIGNERFIGCVALHPENCA